MTSLFSPLQLRSVALPNRIAVSPMCQYSSEDGFANDWHLVHLGSRAMGGAGLVFTEAAAVLPEGRITPQDLGIWKDEHIPRLRQIVDFLHGQGTLAAIQLAHAGRKASMSRPWEPDRLVPPSEGGWTNIVAPTAIPFAPHYGTPHEMDSAAIDDVKQAFAAAARRSLDAGFDVVEIHAAHGYLLHEFLSPLSNRRTDGYGGSRDNRMRLLLETAETVRAEWPAPLPLIVRISATEWTEGGWEIEDSIELARMLKHCGADMIDVSSGGNVPAAAIPTGPGYQVPFAEQIRREADIPTAAVGQITAPAQAEQIVRSGQADLVLLAREMLRDPYWVLHAADVLRAQVSWPPQYLRAAHSTTPARQPVAVNRELD